MKSYTQHIKQMYNSKQTFMSILFSINTQRKHRTMNLDQTLLLIQISIHGCSYTSLCMLFFSILIIMLQYTMRVSISHFPLALSKYVYSRIKFCLPALTTLNSFYLPRTRANRSMSDYNLQVCFIKLSHLRLCNNFKKLSKSMLVLVQLSFTPHWLA
jgi:hypothetical protein